MSERSQTQKITHCYSIYKKFKNKQNWYIRIEGRISLTSKGSLTWRGTVEHFWGVEDVCYLDMETGNKGIHIYKNSLSCTLKNQYTYLNSNYIWS